MQCEKCKAATWIEERSNKAGFPLKSRAAVILKIEEIFAIDRDRAPAKNWRK